MKSYIRVLVVFFIVIVAGCATSSQKQISAELIPLEFSGLYIRPLEQEPVTWMTVKLENNTTKTFNGARVQVVDVTNNDVLYGGERGFNIGGFSSDPEKNWPLDMVAIAPQETGYISVNAGTPKGSILKMSVTLTSTDSFTAINEIEVNISDVESVNQM